MGFYSRAYTFALYPRKFLAAPVQSVSTGAYAELKDDRKRLSQIFYRTNALLIRTSFLFAGILALIAPELIRLLLGEKWLPMLGTFRLMLVYTLLDPFKLTIADVFVAVGKPEKIAFTRAVQLFAMGVGLFVLGSRFGIAGVAVAVDLMLLIGIAILLWQARAYVDYSLKRLFLVPLISLTVSLGLALLAVEIPLFQGSDWHTGFGKSAVFLVTYCGMIALLEFKNFLMLIDFLISIISRRQK
jgi:PST family polysaccharide transporter